MTSNSISNVYEKSFKLFSSNTSSFDDESEFFFLSYDKKSS